MAATTRWPGPLKDREASQGRAEMAVERCLRDSPGGRYD